MDALDEVKALWSKTGGGEEPITYEQLDMAIAKRIRRERRSVIGYFWSAFVYQNIMLAILGIVMGRFPGDPTATAIGMFGFLLYGCSFLVLVMKFRSYDRYSATLARDVQSHVRSEVGRLATLFRFKKRFDLLAAPLACAVIVLAIFRLFVQSSITGNLLPAAMLYGGWVVLFAIAIRSENKKRFENPLRRLNLLLEDLAGEHVLY